MKEITNRKQKNRMKEKTKSLEKYFLLKPPIRSAINILLSSKWLLLNLNEIFL